jgi:hypothetical protein
VPRALSSSGYNRNPHNAIGTGALGIDDDPNLVVDEVVCIIGEEWVHAWPGNPGHLLIGQRDLSSLSPFSLLLRAASRAVRCSRTARDAFPNGDSIGLRDTDGNGPR